MNSTTATMVKRMMECDQEWAPTLMRRTDIDLTVDEPDPEPSPKRDPIPIKEREVIVFDIWELTTCPACKMKTLDPDGKCLSTVCDPPKVVS